MKDSDAKVGIRVTRYRDMNYPGSELIHGTITKVEHDVPVKPPVTGGPDKVVVSVMWDGEFNPRGGYFPHGLNREDGL